LKPGKREREGHSKGATRERRGGKKNCLFFFSAEEYLRYFRIVYKKETKKRIILGPKGKRVYLARNASMREEGHWELEKKGERTPDSSLSDFALISDPEFGRKVRKEDLQADLEEQ